MLLMHILNFYIGQLTVFDALLNRLSGRVRVDMDGYILSVIRDGDALADSFEICAQLADILVALAAGDELRAVGVAAVCGVFVRFLFAFRFLRLVGVKVHFLAVEHIGHRGENADKSAAACVNDACFFEHGEDIRRVGKGGFRALETDVKHLDRVRLAVVHCLAGILGRRADNGEDRALGGLHDCFICRGTAVFERGGYRCTVSLVKTLEPLGNSAEYEREDNAGVASCAAQQT